MDNIYIQKVLDGDHNAFRFLIQKYQDLAFSYAMSIVKDEYKAQEVLQVAFINCFSKLKTFRKEAKFSTWLYRIVVNEAFKAIKKEQKSSIDYNEDSNLQSLENDTIANNDEIDYHQFYINKALKELGAKESLALRLFYLEEHSIKDITEITGWNANNIKVLLHRGRQNMKKKLETYTNKKIDSYKQWMN